MLFGNTSLTNRTFSTQRSIFLIFPLDFSIFNLKKDQNGHENRIDRKKPWNPRHLKTSKSSVFINQNSMDEALNTINENSLKDRPKPKKEGTLEPRLSLLKDQQISELKQKLTVTYSIGKFF